ncbi:MAG: ornithine cyclodeaminase family protein [Giesbergeria sp.]|uniref:ornithine cyclodeaminase family protein n=1 Tax=Giesbergeria sp. TaxID=2818473 RepID=UPI002608CD9D|nr:ornithine cyclodeaminase family protein [Giesbergeria sp.]MDD2610220.1 ornithine cyclodeaminase family protein [Giesbergeria sp.]
MSHSSSGAATPTPFVTDADVAVLAQWPAAIEALRNAYAQPATDDMVPPRVMARGQGFWLRGLCAISPSAQYMGCKLIAASPKIKRASYLISLFDQRTMELAALIDGNRITDIRTAATSVVGINAAAKAGPLRVGVIGSSTLARNTLEALAAVRDIATVRVFSPSPANRQKYADDFKASHGLDIVAVDSPAQAVQGADVVLCAARSKDESPVFLGEWLEPGMVVVSVGSTLPEQREVDVAAMERATLIVADMVQEIIHDTGDAIAAVAAGVEVAAKTVGLADVVSGRVAARRSPEDIVIYKSVGSALQDIATAEMLLRRALDTGHYLPMPASIVTITR